MSSIGICGAAGRVGTAVLKILLEKGHTIAFAFESEKSPVIGRDAGILIHSGELNIHLSVINEEAIRDSEGIIDFSSPKTSIELLKLAQKEKKPIVIGTTGLSTEDMKTIKDISSVIPVLYSPNMSLGVNLLFKLTEMASRALPGYDIELVEAHHRFKKDAPSGTAKRLVEIIKESAGNMENASEITGRNGMVGERSDHEIGIFPLRGGNIVGEHTVYYIGMEERIELTHRAASRDAFARGAVLAMEYLRGKAPGLYSMFDVLGI